MAESAKNLQVDIIKQVCKSPAEKVKLAITDMDGILRGKYIHTEKFRSIVESGFGFCNVVFGWDANDLLYENADYTGWHTGYPDANAKIDFNTYRKVPWDNNVPFFLADFYTHDNKPLAICPRNLLKKVIAHAEELGFKALFAQEFEWFNFQETPALFKAKGFINPQPVTPGMFGYSLLHAGRHQDYFNDLFDLLKKFGVPLEGLHTETGPGTYEAAILYSDVLTAADRAVLFKAGVKEIAMKYGIMPSFMAKWSEHYPGCSGHLHQSLWDLEGKKNLFFDKKEPDGLSSTMRSYIAGILHCLPHILPLFAPNVNSYKRLVEGAWAPTTLSWAIDNRTTTIRVLPGSETATRIELRVVGADVNPYLAMAASLAAGLYGIENNLQLEMAMTQGNGYADAKNGRLAETLLQAIQLMENSAIATELFGEDFSKHFIQTRHWEWQQSLKAVTNWELERYFEII